MAAAVRDDRLAGDALQLVGDGLLAALDQDVGGVEGRAAGCVAELQERGWDGDDDLADRLAAALGQIPTPMLRQLPVDLEELAGILEGDPVHGGGRIDLVTGEVWPNSAIEYAREVGEKPDSGDEEPGRWLWVECKGSRDGYRDMEWFTATVTDPALVDRLEIALDGRGAFRRFKDLLGAAEGELERWYGFSEECQRGRARSWLDHAGYTLPGVPPKAPSSSSA